MIDRPDGISFLGAWCPAHVQLRTVILQPGDGVDYRPADWADALVVIERGQLEIECRSGTRAGFGSGAVLMFTGLPVRRLCNAGDEPLVLSAVSRSHSR